MSGLSMSKQSRMNDLPLKDRLRLLRNGLLSDWETAALAADLGSANYIEAKPDVESLLNHESPLVRSNALATLAYEWGESSNTGRILEIALSDPDRDCRRQAAGALGALFRGSRNREVTGLLASMARNQDEADDVRAFAYTATLDVIGIPRSAQPNPTQLTVGPDDLRTLGGYLRDL
jgi:hypothetical protein